MTQMFPKTLLAGELKSQGERKVFDAVRDQLDDSWEAFHSAAWLTRDSKEGSKDGEIDFVLAHPDHGVLCLEVKGGGLECQHGEWFRLEKGGKRERMKDPFKQATDHKYALERKLDMVVKGGRKLQVGYGVAFPDISVHKLTLGPHASEQIVIDRNDMDDIGSAIDRILSFHAGSDVNVTPPGAQGMAKLRDALAPDLRIPVPMAQEFLDEEEALITLTHDQALLLNRHSSNRRMVVTGPAGSGKTMLAVERARRLSEKGKKVLFICFNRALRDHLRQTKPHPDLLVNTFHGACMALAKKAGVELSTDDGSEPGSDFFSDELPAAFMSAVDVLGKQYDALFVDEAQDLNEDWLDALLYSLTEQDPYVWLFMDDNQRVYESTLEPPDGYMRWNLNVNCRNTQKIHAEVMKKYVGEVEPEVAGPEGRDLEYYETSDPASVIRDRIASLCGQQEVQPQDIVVLSSHGIDKSAVVAAGCGKYAYVKEPKPVGPYIRFSSIRGFKGLEAPVVILCELEDLDDDTIDKQLYVGFSRARNHSIVLAPEKPGTS